MWEQRDSRSGSKKFSACEVELHLAGPQCGWRIP
jgi:hypothetical protein